MVISARQALRSIEETLKTLDPARAAEIEQIRYEAYDIDAALTLAMGAAGADFTGWRLCLLLTESLCAEERIAQDHQGPALADHFQRLGQ